MSSEETWPVPQAEAQAEPDEAEKHAVADALAEPQPQPQPEAEVAPEPEPEPEPAQPAPGELAIPDEVAVLEGSPSGAERHVGVVVSRAHGEVANGLLQSALDALEAAGVGSDRITVMPVPSTFELPIGAMALAKTRRFGCIVGLGCVLPEDGPHVGAEAASGLQLAGLETGVPVSFGVIDEESEADALARGDEGARAARAALEMADLFGQIRAQVKSGG